MKLSIITFITILLTGCTIGRSDTLLPEYNKIPSMQPYQSKAIILEKKDDLHLALANWRVAEKLLIDKINTLTEHIDNNAEKHYQKGLTFYNTGFDELAKLEFVKTLRYDRSNHEALSYLNDRLKKSRVILYEIKLNDDFRTIAESIYKDSESGYIVKYFSGINEPNESLPGTIIKLHILNVD